MEKILLERTPLYCWLLMFKQCTVGLIIIGIGGDVGESARVDLNLTTGEKRRYLLRTSADPNQYSMGLQLSWCTPTVQREYPNDVN